MPVASSGFIPSGSLTTPDVIACSAEPIAADMVCEPASMPPAAPVGSAKSFAPRTTSARPRTLETTARTTNLIPSPFRLLMNDGPTRKPTPYMKR
ncbi:hypothetical protein ABIF64_008031 [Bradyrhizobium japonicum]